jgi:hypothetical protein
LILFSLFHSGDYKKLSLFSSKCINNWREDNTINLGKDIVPIDEPHVSLSKPFVLRSHQIERFLDLMSRQLGIFQRYHEVLNLVSGFPCSRLLLF